MTKQPRPVSAATQAMLDQMEADAAAPAPADKLEAIKKHVLELREKELDKSRLEEDLKSTNIAINELLWTKIPTVMDEAMVPSITIAAEGNKPAFTVATEDYYKANIPGEHATEAYALLKKMKSDDLIKRSYTISFGMGEAKAAERFERSLKAAKIEYSTTQGVPWNSLTAWFREEYKRKPAVFNTKIKEILGATVGRCAKVVKPKKGK